MTTPQILFLIFCVYTLWSLVGLVRFIYLLGEKYRQEDPWYDKVLLTPIIVNALILQAPMWLYMWVVFKVPHPFRKQVTERIKSVAGNELLISSYYHDQLLFLVEDPSSLIEYNGHMVRFTLYWKLHKHKNGSKRFTRFAKDLDFHY